jgi:hypothetical protein
MDLIEINHIDYNLFVQIIIILNLLNISIRHLSYLIYELNKIN